MLTTEIYFISMSMAFLLAPYVIILLIEIFSSNYKNLNFRNLFINVYKNKYIFLIALAFTLPLIWQFIPHAILKTREVNFVQHALGGGFAVGLICIYIINFYKNKYDYFLNFLFQILFIYFTVSAFGALNEILEFLLDFLGLGIFSADRYDTWYDIVANTTGAFAALISFWIFRFLFKFRKNL